MSVRAQQREHLGPRFVTLHFNFSVGVHCIEWSILVYLQRRGNVPVNGRKEWKMKRMGLLLEIHFRVVFYMCIAEQRGVRLASLRIFLIT